MDKLKYIVKEEANMRQILKNEFNFSERFLRKLKLNNRIYCNDIPVWANADVKKDDIITIDIKFDEESEKIISEDIPIEVLYEDTSILIVNKPSNMVVHPTCLHQNGTLANAIKYYLESKYEHTKMHFVNRIDRDTSGIVIFAKNEYIQESLSRQMAEGIFKKSYIAIVEGIVEQEKGTIDLPIKRDTSSIMLRQTAADGERAVTHYEVIKRVRCAPQLSCSEGILCLTMLKIILETGRTHQIRVHMKAIEHPIVGDDLYGNKSELIGRQALHAWQVEFIHPITKKKMEICANIPEDIKKIECL